MPDDKCLKPLIIITVCVDCAETAYHIKIHKIRDAAMLYYCVIQSHLKLKMQT